MVNEDPNYFIKDEGMRSKVKLFDAQVDEFDEDKDMKIRGKIIRQQFLTEKKQERLKLDLQKLGKQIDGPVTQKRPTFNKMKSTESVLNRPNTTMNSTTRIVSQH